MRTSRTDFIRRPRVKMACPFCSSGENPDYKNWQGLGGYLSDRGKIVSRSRSGLCAKHQRRLAKAIKRARHLALVPFLQQV